MAYGETRDYHAIDNTKRVKMTAGMATSAPLSTRFTLRVSDSLICFHCPTEQVATDCGLQRLGSTNSKAPLWPIAAERMRQPSGDDTYALLSYDQWKIIGTTAVLVTLGIVGDCMLLSARESEGNKKEIAPKRFAKDST
jgi:hypothetical protein